jgi:hypothetical protein
MKTLERILRRDSKGQSLVETALFLPIMIVMLLGIVEVSTLLINQNRVTTAARIAAGYGAANFEGNDWRTFWPTLAEEMGIVVRQTVTDTLNLDEDLWDIWSVYAQVNSDGNGFAVFTATHVYGGGLIVGEADWGSSVEAQVRSNLLAELQAGGNDISGLGFVISIPYHNSATFLSLPIWQWVGFKTVSDLTAMRVDRPVIAGGCDLLPIALRLNQPSLYPSNWPKDGTKHASHTDPSLPTMFYPTDSSPNDKFDNIAPSNKPWVWPTYENTVTAPELDANAFERNVPGVSLLNARPGYLFRAREEEENTPGGFGWVCWTNNCSAPDTTASLSPPGNFLELYPLSKADMDLVDTPDGSISGDGNGWLEPGEWVLIGQGNQQLHADILLAEYIKEGRSVVLIIYDESGGSGWEKMFRVYDYATVKIVATGFTGNDKFIIFEFVSWSADCLNYGN